MPQTMRTVQQGAGWPAILTNVLIDQTVWTATIHCVNFLTIGLLEGQGPRGALRKLRAGLLDAVVAGYKMWPAIQLGVYGLVPPRHRLMVVMMFNFVWSIILSGLLNRKQVHAGDREK